MWWQPIERLWSIGNHIKNAWEWYAIIATLSVSPVVPLMLGLLEGQPASVIALYVMAIMGHVIVLLVEGRPLADQVRARLKRKDRSLRIQWGHEAPFVYRFNTVDAPTGKVQSHRLFRIAVKNEGTKTIDQVSVELHQILNLKAFHL